MLHVYGYDTLREVVTLTYKETKTLGDGTVVNAGDPVDLSPYVATGLHGELRAYPGTRWANAIPDTFKVPVTATIYGNAADGKALLVATSADCGIPQALDPPYPHLSIGLFDIHAPEIGTGDSQLIFQDEWQFHHSATQPAGT